MQPPRTGVSKKVTSSARSFCGFADYRFFGTFAPDRRASDKPIAIACFLLVTFLPELPLRSVPRLRSRMTFSTFSPAFFPYFLAMVLPFFISAQQNIYQRMTRQALIAIAVVLSAATSYAKRAPAITTVILVRHAEKAGPTGDVPLNDAGFTRAKELARVLGSAKIAAIYTTPFRRVQQTADPLASALGIEPTVVKTSDTYARDVIAAILRDHKGETVLVVGHSNTTVDVLRQLGFADQPPIPDSEYDDLFVCTLGGASPKLLTLHYGAVAR